MREGSSSLVTGLPEAAEVSGLSSGVMDRRARRFSARCKAEAVMRLLRGEALELVSRELGVTAASLTDWREKFLGAGLEAMKKRPLDEREREVIRLREKVGEITMANELLREKISRMEVGDPLARRRSRR